MPMMVELQVYLFTSVKLLLCNLDSMGFGWSLGFTPYNEWWKNSRRLFHKHFQPSAVPQFRPKKLRAAHTFLRKLTDSPERFHEHLQLYARAFTPIWTVIKVADNIRRVGWPAAQYWTSPMALTSVPQTILTSSAQKNACRS
jgi:hypothetical protein